MTRSNLNALLLVAYIIPREQYDTINGNVDWQIIGISFVIAVHRANDSFASSDEQTRWTVDVVCPSR